jgi:hypothetical protein
MPTVLGDNLIMPKTSGKGIQVDQTSPTFGWHDIIGHVSPKASGAGSPTRSTYRGNIADFSFALNDVVDFTFHIPHDYVPSSDLYYHIHWSHTGTNISGNVVFTTYITYAKGHNQANFPVEISPTITYNTTDITTTPQYRHRIDEIQLSATSPSATQLDSDDIEVDGLIIMTLKVTTLPTITGGNLFIHFTDLHYQSTNIATKQKAPNFYT